MLSHGAPVREPVDRKPAPHPVNPLLPFQNSGAHVTERVLMAELTWPEYEERIRQGAVILIPVGATEQHGHHLPLNVDTLLATEVATRVARDVGGLVMPALTYGYKSQIKMGGGSHFPGTTSLDAHTLSSLLRDMLRELGRHGARQIVVINGHYENQMFTIEGIDLALRDLRAEGIRDMRVVRMEYWDFTTQETLDQIFPEGYPGIALEHAAVIETSLMLHVFPDLVRTDRIPDEPPAQFPPYDVYPPHKDWVPPSGSLSPPGGASAEKGELMMDEVVRSIVAAVRHEFSRA